MSHPPSRVPITLNGTHQDAPPRAVAYWLLICCAMILVMILLGGATRLTHSGLSMVDWDPLRVLPPQDEPAWERAFAQYRQYPEYQKLNQDLDLAGYKSIFWLEYVHRLWGRALGVVFLLPFLYFLILKRLGRRAISTYGGLFLLGGAQGLLGWYMVQSGLKDRPDVSQYRLVAHLSLALLLYGALLWNAVGILIGSHTVQHPLRHGVYGYCALVLVAALSGGFVAGLDAGFAYNTFPLMAGKLVPNGVWLMEPWYRNFFENLITVQFTHRILAAMILVATIMLWLGARYSRSLTRRARLALHCLMATVVVQISLGISLLILVVPVPLGIAHQGCAVLLFSCSLWLVRELRVPIAPSG